MREVKVGNISEPVEAPIYYWLEEKWDSVDLYAKCGGTTQVVLSLFPHTIKRVPWVSDRLGLVMDSSTHDGGGGRVRID